MNYQAIEIERVEKVARIYLNRPDASNAQNPAMLDELDDAFATLRSDESVRVVILAGRGKHFSAGHDLRAAAGRQGHFGVEARWENEEKRYLNYCLNIFDFPKPTICQVQGACIAAGLMVANMCDLIVASEDAYFSDPVVHSMSAASVEVLIHPWVMGLRKAKELLFTGERLPAAEALAIGMVNRVVPAEQLEEATMALAQKIAQASPFGMRLTKRSLNRTFDVQGLRTALSAHFDTHQVSHQSDEFLEHRQKRYADPANPVKKLS